MERHTGHAPFVLFLWAIDVEVAKAHHLVGAPGQGALKILAALATHALVEEELGVTVYVERVLKCGFFAKGI